MIRTARRRAEKFDPQSSIVYGVDVTQSQRLTLGLLEGIGCARGQASLYRRFRLRDQTGPAEAEQAGPGPPAPEAIPLKAKFS